MIRMYITKCLIPKITIYTTQSANKKPVVTLHILNSLILSRLVDTLNDLHGWIQKALHAIRHTGFICLVQPCLDFCDALVETDFSVLVYCRLKVGSSLFCFFVSALAYSGPSFDVHWIQLLWQVFINIERYSLVLSQWTFSFPHRQHHHYPTWLLPR